MSDYVFPVVSFVVGLPKIICKGCKACIAEMRRRDANGYLEIERVHPDGSAHECDKLTVAKKTHCRSCGLTVYYFPNSGRQVDHYNSDGVVHRKTCKAMQIPVVKKKKTQKKGA